MPSVTRAVPTAHWWSLPTSAGGPRQGWKGLNPASSSQLRGAAGSDGAVLQQLVSHPLPGTKRQKTGGFVGSLGGLVAPVSADRHGPPRDWGMLGSPALPWLAEGWDCAATEGTHHRSPFLGCLSTAPPERKIKNLGKKKREKQLEQPPVVNTRATICRPPPRYLGPSRACCVSSDVYGVVGHRGEAGPRPRREAEGGNAAGAPEGSHEGNRALGS